MQRLKLKKNLRLKNIRSKGVIALEKEISRIAKKVYKEYGNNPFSICKEKDYIVKLIDMPASLKGYTTMTNRINIIYINSKLNEKERKFTCLHELGHILLKHDDNILFNKKYTLNSGNKEENEANNFAVQMLLEDYSREDLETLSINQIANLIGVEKNILYIFFNM